VPLKETNGTLEIRTHTLSGKMQNSLWLWNWPYVR
jgi:hypothetical protein